MSKAKEKTGNKKIGIIDKVVHLSGDPESLSGRMTFKNEGKDQVWLEFVDVTFDKGSGLPARADLSAYALIPAREEVQADVTLSLDPTQAPGSYSGNVVLGKQKVPLALSIEPVRSAEFIPDSLTLFSGKSGQTLKASVELHNQGNLPLKVPQAEVEDPLEIEEVARFLARAVRTKGEEGTMPVLDAFVASLKDRLGSGLEVTLKEAGKELAPGEKLDLNLELKVPRAAKGRALEGRILIEEAELRLFVVLSKAPK